MEVLYDVLIFYVALLTISSLGAFVVIKLVPKEAKLELRPVSQATLVVTGMMFATLMGIYIAQAFREFSACNAIIISEANSLGVVFRDAEGLNEKDKVRIRALCRKYNDLVIEDEWPLLGAQKESSKAKATMEEICNAAIAVRPADSHEQIVYHDFLKAVNEFGGFRGVRIATLPAGLGFPSLFNIALAASSLVVLTFLFAPGNFAFHSTILSCLLVPITMSVYLLADFSRPFAGFVVLPPSMFLSLKTGPMAQNDLVQKPLNGQAH
jgi:hypothetical protein